MNDEKTVWPGLASVGVPGREAFASVNRVGIFYNFSPAFNGPRITDFCGVVRAMEFNVSNLERWVPTDKNVYLLFHIRNIFTKSSSALPFLHIWRLLRPATADCYLTTVRNLMFYNNKDITAALRQMRAIDRLEGDVGMINHLHR